MEWSNPGFDFIYDKDGRWVYFVNEIDGSQTYSEIPFLGGRYLGSYRSDGTHLTHANRLGSTRMETNAAGGVMEDQLFYPWGQFWKQGTSGWSFASMPYRDQPLGHDLTPNRIYDYGTAPGRWLSPDPLAGDIMNPQSLNRYAYALNNPTTLTDPLGLDPFAPGTPPGVYCVNVIGTTNSSYDGSWQFQIESLMNFLNGLNQEVASYGNGGNPGGGGSGAGSTVSGLKSKVCSTIPQGRTIGVSGGIGGIGGQTGSLELVINYSTGQVSGFASGGVHVGWNGVAQGSAFTGVIYGPLNGNNSGYTEGFSTVAGSIGTPFSVGGYVSASSGGLTGGLSGLGPTPGGVKVVGASIGASLLGPATGTFSATNYTEPLQLGKYWAFSPIDLGYFLAQQVCK